MMIELKNPVEAAIEDVLARSGLTKKADFAMLSGGDVSHVSQAVHGRVMKPAGSILRTLAQFGYDPDDMIRQYREWRQAKAQEFMARQPGAAR